VNLQPHSSAPSVPPSGARERGLGGAQGSEEIAITGRFSHCAKLLRHGDFQRVYKQGRRHFGTQMTVFYLAGQELHSAGLSAAKGPRIGFTVSRALGGAVQRNRIKRRMREAVRANLPDLTARVDVVINPKKSAQTADFALLRKEVARAFAVIQQYCAGRPPASEIAGPET
jgi:ribonuclease P protein component